MRRDKRFLIYAAVAIITVATVGTILVVNSNVTEAQDQIETTPTIEPTATFTPSPTPTVIPRHREFDGNSELNTNQPILSKEFIDPLNNRGYSDANAIRIQEIGLRTLTNELIWRVRIKDTNEVVEERFATAREAARYTNYVRELERKNTEQSNLEKYKTQFANFDTLTPAVKDQLLKNLLAEIIKIQDPSFDSSGVRN